MVWKCDFFWWFMRLVRVPPYESWANWTNFLGSWENGKFFWGQTCCTLLHTQNEEKSQKISTCIRIHTRVYANTWWWGQICPPPALIGLRPALLRSLLWTLPRDSLSLSLSICPRHTSSFSSSVNWFCTASTSLWKRHFHRIVLYFYWFHLFHRMVQYVF